MITTTSRPETEPADRQSQADDLEPFRRRWWSRLAAALGVAALLGVADGWFLAQMDNRVLVLALAHGVGWADTIIDADLTVIKAAPAEGAAMIAAKDRKAVVGRTARTGFLPAGTILAWDQLSPAWHPVAGEHLVGLRSEQGHRPLRELRPGDLILVSPIGAADDAFRARVADSSAPDRNGTMTVDVIVGRDTIPAAITAASGTVLIVLVVP